GSTFVVSDRRGDIDAGPDQPHGLFFRDTRFLSRRVLSVEDRPLEVLSTDDIDYFSAQFFLYPPTAPIYRNPDLPVLRQRTAGDEGLALHLARHDHGEWQTCVDVVPVAGSSLRTKHGHGSITHALPNMELKREDWLDQAPKLDSSWDKLGHIYWRSLVDLAAL